MPKQVKATKIEVIHMNKTKSAGSPKINKNKASKVKMVKRHDSSETKLQDVSYSAEESSILRKQSRKHLKETNKVPMLEDKHVSIITKDDSVAESVLDDHTTDKTTKEIENILDDLQGDTKLHTDGLPRLEHGRASSPVSYVFFSHERQKSAVFDEININAKRNTGISMNPNSRAENTEQAQSIKDGAECYSADNNKDNYKEAASQLYLLQQILLKLEGNLNDTSPGANAQLSNDNLINPEETECQNKSDQSKEVHSVHVHVDGCDDLDDCQDTQALQNFACLCSRENCCCYESDSTLNEEYLFSDNSFAFSPSEDEECEICSRFTELDKNTKELPQQMYQVGTATQNIRVCYIRKTREGLLCVNIYVGIKSGGV